MTVFAPISVVIPCYRCSKTIERAVASVASQTNRPIELILVDDCSTDKTNIVLQNLVNKYEPGWIRLNILEKNVGVASARNIGWGIATQPYIAFLDSDDVWHPKKIEIQYNYMELNNDVVLCGHGHRVLSQNESTDWEIIEGKEEIIKKWGLILSNKFITPSVMVRRNIQQRFIEKQRYMEDHMLWLAIVCSGGRTTKLNFELAATYKNSFGISGLSSRIWLMEQGDLENYHRLYKFKFIKKYQFFALCIYSIFKYMRRLVIYGGHILWRK